jgi:hypothetical protein
MGKEKNQPSLEGSLLQRIEKLSCLRCPLKNAISNLENREAIKAAGLRTNLVFNSDRLDNFKEILEKGNPDKKTLNYILVSFEEAEACPELIQVLKTFQTRSRVEKTL